ncbi:diaminopimelate epimerase [Candidatus Formimonas warabiya]|uniref:Diaminopimelate epimerase n=1 Tax=Formimonas warabiya TaxID=1761012 RepID=A0A3G1KXN9_FORW1|nr:diaminopimelate epimerase [Candidatus Formimonas warabiya]ATW26975.1 diaminopimelate epimerase [Candidatus Formimonas warabiya]
MEFLKMQGLGNDFVVVDAYRQELPEDLGSLAQKVCHRQFGIGADGLVLVLPSEKAAVKMRIFNADGSEPEMCGNGIRCLAKYVYESGLCPRTEFTVETLAGVLRPELMLEKGRITGVKVDMGEPRLSPDRIPVLFAGDKVVGQPLEVQGEKYVVTAVSMGNPHCLIFVDDVSQTPVKSLGPLIEVHPLFPAKINVEFVEIVNKKEVKMRVWERGAGETLACGTGACATVVACALNGKTDREITVHLLGGDLILEWAPNNHVFMTGPAEAVFEGRYFI